MGLDGMIGLGSLAAIRAGEANVAAAAAGDGDIPAVGVDSDHAGVRHGAAHECCDQPCEFASRDWNLQSLLLICERVGCAVVLGTGDDGGFGDCIRVAAAVHLRESGGAAILSVFRGVAGGDDVFASCNYAADADDQSVADSFRWDHAGDDDVAFGATLAGGLADFGWRDWLVRHFLAQALCCAALDRAWDQLAREAAQVAGNGGIVIGDNLSFFFYLTYFTPYTSPVTTGYLRGFCLCHCVRATCIRRSSGLTRVRLPVRLLRCATDCVLGCRDLRWTRFARL